MRWNQYKFALGFLAFLTMTGYAWFGDVDILTGKALTGLGLLFGLGLFAGHHSSEQKQ